MRMSLISILFIINCFAVSAQANLTIENNSQRSMTIKIMRGSSGKGTLHETVVVPSFGSRVIYFQQSGYYFTKSKAVLNGKEPVYQKGQAFQVTNDDSGYSVMTLTFTIKESKVPQVMGGKRISKTEFDQN